MSATSFVQGARSLAASRALVRAQGGRCSRVLMAAGMAVGLVALGAKSALAQVVLNLNGGSLTNYVSTGKTARQDLRPRFEQRGVDIDGTMRAMQVNGWAIAADSIGGGYGSGRKIGDINLATGTYAPTDIDLVLPSIGVPVVIGRSYNHMAENSGRYDSDGYQGKNWGQLGFGELVKSSDSEYIYLVYGADRYIEFKRTGESSTEWKSKNGAAGAITKTAGGGETPDTYRLSDQRGNDIYFMGFDGVSGAKSGQWWKSVDPAGYTSFVGHATTPV